MIAPFAAQQAGSGALTAGALIGQCDLQRGISGFRSRIGEEYMIQVGGEHVAHAAGQFEGLGMAELEGRGKIQLGDLLLHGLHNFRIGMTAIDAPQSSGAVQDVFALSAFVIHALGGDQDARISLEPAIGGKGHPKGAKVVLLHPVGHVFPPKKVITVRAGSVSAT